MELPSSDTLSWADGLVLVYSITDRYKLTSPINQGKDGVNNNKLYIRPNKIQATPKNDITSQMIFSQGKFQLCPPTVATHSGKETYMTKLDLHLCRTYNCSNII